MDFLTLASLALSAERGWPELLRERPGWLRLCLQLVLPVALVPPAVLYLAGTVPPDAAGVGGVGGEPWGELSALVLLGEIASVAAAALLLRHIALAHGLRVARRDASLVALLAPLPLWAATAGVALPGVLAPTAIALAGVALACGIAYHGLVAICRPREEIVAAVVVHLVAGAGLAAWAAMAALLGVMLA